MESETGQENGADSVESEEPLEKIERTKMLLERKLALLSLSHAPVYCPISSCKEVVFSTGYLTHFLDFHKPEMHLHEAFTNERVIFPVNLLRIDYGQEQCIGGLVYAGKRGHPNTAPTTRFLSFANIGLLGGYERLRNHLLITVMAARTCWAATLKNKKFIPKQSPVLQPKQHIYVIWCVAVECTKKIFTTMTLFNMEHSQARGVIRHVRNIRHAQVPSEFLCQDHNYMRLSLADVESLSNADGLAQLEVIIHESAEIKEVTADTTSATDQDDCWVDGSHGSVESVGNNPDGAAGNGITEANTVDSGGAERTCHCGCDCFNQKR